MEKVLSNLIDITRKYFFYFRKGGIREFLKFYELNKFEKKIFKEKKLIWNDLGYWEVYPMPTDIELEKFYSEIYWLNNKYYKSNLVIPRDISHLEFLQKNVLGKFNEKINFVNFGAGHGGISYLMTTLSNVIINIEPSELNSYGHKNFINFKNIDNFIDNKENYKKIDVLYSSHALEHLSDPITFFEKISKILIDNGLVFIEVPNCRKAQIDKDYTEGGCDGKIWGSHLLYFTKDFFKKLDSEIFFVKEEEQGQRYIEVDSEDKADCIRAIIKAKNIKDWIKGSKIN